MFLAHMLMLGGVAEFAKSAIAVLIAILAIYLSIRLLGKLAKFVIMVIVFVVVIWFLSNSGILAQLTSALQLATSWL